ncbi:MAG: NAD-glutamate dehydrogenase [Legionella sp.]|nr:NAD-glutamate dehydrogenase [Legionella sp.]
MVMSWKEQLEKKLIEESTGEKSTLLHSKYNNSFSASYMDIYTPDMAFDDITYLEKLSPQNPLEMNFYSLSGQNENFLHLRLFQWKKPIPLSDILPMLENFDLRTESEIPHKVKIDDKCCVYISDFTLIYSKQDYKVDDVKELFRDAFTNVYFSLAENDGFNKLVLGALLSVQEVGILRTYAKYLLQIGFRFSQSYIEKALACNTSITRDLVDLFKTMHDPDINNNERRTGDIEQQISQKLELVTSLDEDRIIRRLLALMKATLRTNFFQGNEVDYLAIKLESSAIPELPLPKPLYEIFVYSPRFEAIHLRKEKIARGGIRWSDRPEDFRTEILGLMKAQVVKNTVIVPSGAKGGFVLKTIPPLASREEVQVLVINCYKSFIRALLDLTDNIIDADFIPPPRVVCYDSADPYLVVAADKGTSTFSDIANGISKEYDFWLGDAFASGGSAGYDHKKMGITARGAWESIKRHFRELDCDVKREEITVIGIGDMSGDVFGNGMLYSENIKLLGAFDHRHIFIDPTPDTRLSYEERNRLFNLPTSSWEDYNPELISKGGGVFKRSLKSITLTPEMKQAFAVDADALPPNELITALLKAPVDLLFNGGIGTYVKSSQETAADVGDRTNDFCRVNGDELRCKVVGEGGNLGFTQRGRVEYALNGGLIFTDFIDNSAGVDCSDHEVNLKILLNSDVNKGIFTEEKRNELLTSLTEEVAHLVLNDNYEQALVLSFSAFSAKNHIGLHTEYIKELEMQNILNRQVEFLPSDKELVERKTAALGLTRPELATLMAYTKIYLKQEILASSLPEDPYLNQILETAFPPSVREMYQSQMFEHRLKRYIVATQLSNEVVNKMGLTFVYRMQRETGATVEEIIRAYTLAAHSFETDELQRIIESLDFKIPLQDQFETINIIRKLLDLSTHWFLHGNHHVGDLNTLVAHYSHGIRSIERLIPELMTGVTKQYLNSLKEKFLKLNLPAETAERIAAYRAIYTSLNIIEVATNNTMELERVARIYFAAGERMNLVWFRDQIASDTRDDHWHALTRLTLRDELDNLQQALSIAILREDTQEPDPQKLIDKWVHNHQRTVVRWEKFLSMLHSNPTVEYTMFFIAIRELTTLILKR